MALGSLLTIGRSGLLTSRSAIEVTGNNLANQATPGYHRQEIVLAPSRAQEIQQGQFIGRGVQISDVLRRVDQALEGRLRNSISDQSASQGQQEVLARIEAIQAEFSDIDISTALSNFFNAWSELANKPQDFAVRTMLLQQGESLTRLLQNSRSGLVDLRTQVDNNIDAGVANMDSLLDRIAQVDKQIVAADGGAGGATGLRDQRDALLAELSESVDISVNEHPSGSIDVFVGSIPVVLNGTNRGVEIKRTSVGDDLKIDVALKADGSILQMQSGRIGALVEARESDVNQTIETLDSFIGEMIWQVNRLHSQGQGLSPANSVTGTYKVDDTSAALNHADAGLEFTPGHGSFELNVTQASTGQRNSTTINIDLDNVDPANNTSLDDLVAAINGAANVNASITADGRLKIDGATGDFEVSFSDDTSGVLAALGVNTFFTGHDGLDVGVNAVLGANPERIAAGLNHEPGDNSNALAIAKLRDTGVNSLGGLTLTEHWNRHIEDVAARLGQVSNKVEADTVVRESLAAQRQSFSGVNADEEAINLLNFQRAFQASARFLNVVDEMFETMLSIV